MGTTQLTDLVETSRVVGSSRSRLAKVDALSALLKALAGDEIGIAVDWLTGALPQGKIGLGYGSLKAAADVPAAASATLSLQAVDACFARIAGQRGAGSAAQRASVLRELFAQATGPEQDFLLRLIIGELRQGALAGVMVDAIAKASALPIASVRRAAMLTGGLGPLAFVALTRGADGLESFSLQLFAPVAPMLAQTAADAAEALASLGEEADFEWKMDGARIQVHKRGDDVRIYTRALNEVGMAVPEVVDAVNGSEGSGLGNGRNGDFQPWNAGRQLGTLSRWRVDGEPPEPLLVHAGKVVFVREHDGGTDDLV